MKLIDKDDIVAEIEKLKGLLLKGACSSQIAMETRCKEEAYDEVLSFLNTIETKEEQIMTVIFQTSTGYELGRWKNWKGEIPQRGDTIYDSSWETCEFNKRFINAHVIGRVLNSTNPNEIIIYVA